jgi:tetracycline repressor-like protein
MELKQEIIVRAEKLYLKLGVRSVTMDDVARELGISKKTLYQHFANKDKLVAEVISTHVDREKAIMDRICEEAVDALDEMLKMGAFITAMIEDISPGALYDLQKYYRKSWERLMKKQDEQTTCCFMKNLERGHKEGLYRKDLNAEIVAKLYGKSTYMIVEELSTSDSKFSRKELIWELDDYHIHAIATPKGLALWKDYGEKNTARINQQLTRQ